MRFSLQGFGVAAALAVAVGLSACGSNLGGTTSSLGGSDGSGQGVSSLTAVSPPDAPPGITNDSPMARPASVAWVAARAKRCAFFFDPEKVRTSYFAYEARQPGADTAKIQSVYDNTYQLILAKTSSDEAYCTEKRNSDIKADLGRVLAADYTPNLPKPMMVANCGMFGCGKEQGKFEAKEFFKEQSKKTGF